MYQTEDILHAGLAGICTKNGNSISNVTSTKMILILTFTYSCIRTNRIRKTGGGKTTA